MSDEPLGFDEIREKLQARGYAKRPISVDGVSAQNKQTLVEVLRTLLSEHDEEVQLRERLLARNRELEHALERTRRTRKQDESISSGFETKLMTTQSQLQSTQAALSEEQASHKATRDQLMRTRKQMSQIKSAAAQYRTSTERQNERLRERVMSLSKSSLKALVPDIRIASPAFLAHSRSDDAPTMRDTQLEEVERRNSALLETSAALKQLALDAFVALYQTNIRLKKILDVESRAKPDTFRGSSSLRCSHTTTSLDNLELHEIFPPLRPLVTDDTEETHPARRHLTSLAESLQEHVAGLSHWAAVQHVGHDQHAKRRRSDE